jgi:outer membrane protein OmpA-like peptidoglycan-associated protein
MKTVWLLLLSAVLSCVRPGIESPATNPPTFDQDGDKISDTDDKCPNEPEDKDGVEDGDGCPETTQRVAIKTCSFAIAPIVLFDKNQSTLREDYHNVIGDVMATLPDLPRPVTVVLEGRAASDEADAMTLSLARANEIKKYMLSAGMPPDVTIEIVGYGHTKPILLEDYEEVDFNRRVDLILNPKSSENNP